MKWYCKSRVRLLLVLAAALMMSASLKAQTVVVLPDTAEVITVSWNRNNPVDDILIFHLWQIGRLSPLRIVFDNYPGSGKGWTDIPRDEFGDGCFLYVTADDSLGNRSLPSDTLDLAFSTDVPPEPPIEIEGDIPFYSTGLQIKFPPWGASGPVSLYDDRMVLWGTISPVQLRITLDIPASASYRFDITGLGYGQWAWGGMEKDINLSQGSTSFTAWITGGLRQILFSADGTNLEIDTISISLDGSDVTPPGAPGRPGAEVKE